jgi:HEAT repeat protein
VLANNISTLVALLEESDALSRRAALDLLSKLSPVSLLTALLGRIIPHLDDDDADVRRGCVAVLARVPSEALNDHAEVLLSFITHESWPVRVTGLEVFACLSASLIQTHLEDVLLISLNDMDSVSVRWAALDLLQKKVQRFLGGGEGGGEAEVEGGVQEGKSKMGTTEENTRSSRCSSRSSSRNGSTTIDSHLEESVEGVILGQATKVVDCFKDSDMFVRWKALSVLGSYPALAVAPELLEALLEALEHPLPSARAAALLALSRLQEGKVVGGDRRKGGEEEEEEEEVEEVEEEERLPLLHQRPRVVHEVCKRVQDDDLAVRWAALHALKALPADALMGAARAEVEEGQGDGWLVAEIARGLRVEGKASVADADSEMHAYVQQATGRLLEKLHEISGGSLVGEEVLEEVRQMRQRQEEERAGRQGAWDDDTYRPD